MQYFISFLLLIWIPLASSIEPVEVGDLNAGYSLNDHVEYVEDTLGEFKAEQLMRPDQP